MRTKAEMREQWLEKFNKDRTPEEWADFCVGMNTEALERAFTRCFQQGIARGASAPFADDPPPNVRIVSGGSPRSTAVLMDGKPMPGVKRIELAVDADGHQQAKVVLEHPELDIAAQAEIIDDGDRVPDDEAAT